MPSPHPSPARRQRGFTVVAVLLLVSFMATMAATLSRSVIVEARATTVSAAAQDSRQLLSSQIDLALQSQRVGRAVSDVAVESAVDAGMLGSGDVELANADQELVHEALSSDEERTRLLSRVSDAAGLGATRLLESGRRPATITSSPDQLPCLDAELVKSVLGNRKYARLDVTSSTTLSGQDLTGLVVVHESAVLTLSDVTVQGIIVSAAAATESVGSTYSDFLAPQVVVTGPVRLEPLADLPDLAIMLPDGKLSMTGESARLYVEGDIVAHTVDLAGEGSLAGNLVTVDTPVLADTIERPGHGRAPAEWSSVLDHGDAWEPTFVAVVPREVALEDLTAITSYTFPAVADSGGGSSGDEKGGGSDKGGGKSK